MVDLSERSEKIQKVRQARDRFLAQHPELAPFQKEIARRLSCAGSTENRITVLRSMMDEKLFELSQACLEAKKVGRASARAFFLEDVSLEYGYYKGFGTNQESYAFRHPHP